MTADALDRARRLIELEAATERALCMGIHPAFLRSQFPDVPADDFDLSVMLVREELHREAEDRAHDDARRAWERDVL